MFTKWIKKVKRILASEFFILLSRIFHFLFRNISNLLEKSLFSERPHGSGHGIVCQTVRANDLQMSSRTSSSKSERIPIDEESEKKNLCPLKCDRV